MVALLSPPISQTSFAGFVEARRANDIAGIAAALSGAVLRGDRFAALTADHPDTRGHVLGLLAEMLAEHAVPVELREPEEIYHLVDGLDQADPNSELASWAATSNGDPYARRPLFVIESAETLKPETIEFLWLASTVLLSSPLAPQILFSGATHFQQMLRSHECRGIREHIAMNVAVDAPPPRTDRAVLTAPAIAEAPSTPPPPGAVRRGWPKWPGLAAAAVFVCAGMGTAALVYDDAAPSGPVTARPASGTERPGIHAAPAIATTPPIAGPAKDAASRAEATPQAPSAASPRPSASVGGPSETPAPSPASALPATAQAANEQIAFAPPAQATDQTAGMSTAHADAAQTRPLPVSPGLARLAQTHVVLQYRAGSADSEAQARQIAASLTGRVASAQIKAVPTLSRTPRMRYFDREDRDAAIELNALLSGALGKARPRHQTDKSGQAASAVIEVQLPRPPSAHAAAAPIRTAHQ
ncbi:MAG: hypothetical protein JOZ42_09325 [Acetobacteraceae bacterium]|nr:hypothetical protein [Acetobacteraceae bacterium]